MITAMAIDASISAGKGAGVDMFCVCGWESGCVGVVQGSQADTNQRQIGQGASSPSLDILLPSDIRPWRCRVNTAASQPCLSVCPVVCRSALKRLGYSGLLCQE